MFDNLAKCDWLFDGFFSHWQLAVESILQLANSNESDQRSFRKRARVPSPQGGGQPTASAPASENFLIWFAWICQLMDGFDDQLPMGEEVIE